MLPYTETIKGKIVLYVYLSLIVLIGMLLVVLTKTRYDGLKSDAERFLRLQVREIAEELKQEHIQGLTIAKTLSQAQESSGLFGKRNNSIELLKHVLIENPKYTGIYYCFEPNADGKDREYLRTQDAYLRTVDSTGRFLPTWIRSIHNPDSLYLTHAVGMESSLYYRGLKERFTSNGRKQYIPSELEISTYYKRDSDEQLPSHYMISEPYMYEGKFMIEYTAPISIDSIFMGVAGIDRTLESFDRFTRSVRRNWKNEFIIVSQMGRVVASTLDTIKTAVPFEQTPYEKILGRFYHAHAVDTSIALRETDPIDGKLYYFAGHRQEMSGWTVISRISENEIMAPIRSQIAISAMISLLGMLALLPVLFWIANSISRPVNQNRKIAEEISQGNFDVQIPPHSTETDTGRVTHALGTLAANVRELLDFRQLAATISAKFVEAERKNIDLIIHNSLRDAGRFIGAESAYLMQFDAGTERLIYTHRWDESGVDALVELNHPYSKDLIPYTIHRLFKGEVVQAHTPYALPPEGIKEREMMEQHHIRSFVMVPLRFSSEFDGALLFISLKEYRIWEKKHIELLRIVGHVFLNALNRIKREQEIQKLNEELEHRVKQRTEQLEAANRELESFSYSVSHDLRTPLRHIDGFTDLLRKRIENKLDEKDRNYLDKISGASQQMGHLIDDLLMFSRMSRVEIIKTTIDTRVLLNDIIEELAPDYKGRTVEFRIGKLPPLYGDPSMLRLVFINLISNSLKFTRIRDHAIITVEGETNGTTTIRVSDNGVGFDPAYAHKLFGVFERLHAQSEFEGTGIGLANIKRIIIRHEGSVAAAGEVDKGAIISFTLPNPPGDTS